MTAMCHSGPDGRLGGVFDHMLKYALRPGHDRAQVRGGRVGQGEGGGFRGVMPGVQMNG
jgi:hypothetical protein